MGKGIVPNDDVLGRGVSVLNIGSVVKPVVYLSALAKPKRYTLASLVDDSAITIDVDGVQWSPRNYDRKDHGAPLTELSSGDASRADQRRRKTGNRPAGARAKARPR